MKNLFTELFRRMRSVYSSVFNHAAKFGQSENDPVFQQQLNRSFEAGLNGREDIARQVYSESDETVNKDAEKSKEATRKQLTNAKGQMAAQEPELNKPFDERIQSCEESIRTENDQKVLSIKQENEALVDKKKDKILKRAKCREEKEALVKRTGRRPTKQSPLEKKSAFVLIFLAIALLETPIFWDVLQQAGIGNPLVNGFYAFGFSACVAACCHLAGRFYAYSQRRYGHLFAILAFILCAVGMHLRSLSPGQVSPQKAPTEAPAPSLAPEAGEQVPIQASLNLSATDTRPVSDPENSPKPARVLNPVLNIMALVITTIALFLAITAFRDRPYWELVEREEKLTSEINTLTGQIERLPEKLKSAASDLKSRARRMAELQEREARNSYQALNARIQALESETARIDNDYESEKKRRRALLKAEYLRGFNLR